MVVSKLIERLKNLILQIILTLKKSDLSKLDSYIFSKKVDYLQALEKR